ncbi:hypothetical protein FA13DRAFT_1731140 [Coprinellus micaceus]|uniref:Uncharacterized protein n=1 Tax=Coprinellus micaceus TaxID=71717 RepID=A0A4Y7TEP0_COPMI|nr:hypothetical protein FA13DRAFT_1731140 [Coprinellus micaceus]
MMQGPQLPRRCEANAVRTPPVRTKPLLSSLTPSDGNVEICCSEILRLVYTERNEGPGGRYLKTTCGDNNHHQLDTNGSLRIGPRCSGSNRSKGPTSGDPQLNPFDKKRKAYSGARAEVLF